MRRATSFACYTKPTKPRDLPEFKARFRTRAAAEIFAQLFDLRVNPESLTWETTKELCVTLAQAIRRELE